MVALGDSGLRAGPGDAGAFADRILRLLGDPEAAAFGRRGAETARQFDADELAGAYGHCRELVETP